VRAGLARLKAFFVDFGVEEQLEEDGMVKHLRRIEASLREQHKIGITLQEQLDEAIAKEEYIKRSSKFGVRGEHRHVVIPPDKVARITQLGNWEPASSS